MTTFGSDPEFLLVDDKGLPKSAIGVLPNEECSLEKDGNLYYYDNVLAECTVKPGSTKEEVLNNFRSALKGYAEVVRPYRLTTRASADFPKEELSNPEAQRAGCAPDNCAYTMRMCKPPKKQFQNGTLRSCGGHIHLGENFVVKNEEGPQPIFVIYMMDLFLGIPSLFMDNDPTSQARRSLYGQAGRYRKKAYGVEYRSLGNFWLQSPTFVSTIYDLSMFAVKFVEDGQVNKYWSFDEELFYEADDISEAFKCTAYDAQALKLAIDTSDKEAAKPFLKLAKSHLPTNLAKAITNLSRTRPKDLYDEWNL